MRFRYVLAFAFALALLAASAPAWAAADDGPEARTWKVGERVVALWKPDKVWYYAGTVREVKDGKYLVVFDDGDKDWLTPAEVTPDDLVKGDVVEGNFKKKGVYYPGKIASRTGDQIRLRYDDGDEEDTTIAIVRVRRPRK